MENIFENFTDEDLTALEQINPRWYDDLTKLNSLYHPTSLWLLKKIRNSIETVNR